MEKQTSGISFTPFSFTHNGLSLSSKRIYLPTLTQQHSLQSLLLQNTSHTVAATDTEFSGESGKFLCSSFDTGWKKSGDKMEIWNMNRGKVGNLMICCLFCRVIVSDHRIREKMYHL